MSAVAVAARRRTQQQQHAAHRRVTPHENTLWAPELASSPLPRPSIISLRPLGKKKRNSSQILERKLAAQLGIACATSPAAAPPRSSLSSSPPALLPPSSSTTYAEAGAGATHPAAKMPVHLEEDVPHSQSQPSRGKTPHYAATVLSPSSHSMETSSTNPTPHRLRKGNAGYPSSCGSSNPSPHKLRKGMTAGYLMQSPHAKAEEPTYPEKFLHRGRVIDPRTSKWVQYWDLSMTFALIATALVTPFEVAFLESGEVNGLFVFNRVIDCFFILDMLGNFHIAYQDPKAGGWVVNQYYIIRSYLHGWFLIDLCSILPLILVPFVLTADEKETSTLGMLRIARIIRLLRLLKMVRVLKQSRLFRQLEAQMEVSYAVIKLTSLISSLCFWAHWQACLWGLIVIFQADDAHTWLRELEDRDTSHGLPVGPFERYIASLYFSLMTITSIGYGEMLPVNTFERLVSSLMMFFSSIFWCYVIGTASGIAATLDPEGLWFQTNLDALNHFMAERRLPRELRVQLREFFHNARELHRVEGDSELLSLMSPLLQGKVALQANKEWLERVWYLKAPPSDEGPDIRMLIFYANIAKHLAIKPYVAQERIPLGFLYILRRGLVVKMWRFLVKGRVWGEDVILDNPDLIDHSQAVALTYVEVFSLSRHDLEDVAKDYPDALRRIRLAAKRMGLQRRLLMYMKQYHNMPVKSYIPPAQAKGYDKPVLQLSQDQKLDILISVDPRARRFVSKIKTAQQPSCVSPSSSAVTELSRERMSSIGTLGGSSCDEFRRTSLEEMSSRTDVTDRSEAATRMEVRSTKAQGTALPQLLRTQEQLAHALEVIGQLHAEMGKQLQGAFDSSPSVGNEEPLAEAFAITLPTQ